MRRNNARKTKTRRPRKSKAYYAEQINAQYLELLEELRLRANEEQTLTKQVASLWEQLFKERERSTSLAMATLLAEEFRKEVSALRVEVEKLRPIAALWAESQLEKK